MLLRALRGAATPASGFRDWFLAMGVQRALAALWMPDKVLLCCVLCVGKLVSSLRVVLFRR